MKIVGIGLNKTGTTSLGVCFEHWGLSHVACSQEAFELWRQGDIQSLLEWVNKFDSLENWPWSLIYREIDQAFPGTKFILTRRKTAEAWFASLNKHASRTGPTDFRKHIFGFDMPEHHKKEHIQFYEDHLNAARQYFKGRPKDFLEVCWEEGDGWDELSAFLGFDSENIPFPHAHKSPTVLDKGKNLLSRTTKRLMGST